MLAALVTASAITSRALSANLTPDGLQGEADPKGSHGEDESPHTDSRE